MKKTILLALLLLNSLIYYSQIDSTKIAFISYWNVGDSDNFKVTKIKKEWKEGKLIKNQEQSYIANFKIISSTDTSYVIKWSYEQDLKKKYKIPQKLVHKFSKYKLTEIIYRTSEVGEFIEVLNWKEVSKIMNSMFNDVVEVLGKNDESLQKKLKKSILPIKKIYSSKNGIEQLVVKELRYFHFPMGVEFDITKALYYDEEIPNVFGGKPIKGKVKLYFENVDFKEYTCTLKYEMDLNPKDTKKLLKQVFKKLNLDNKKMKKALNNAVFIIKDRNSYEYYYDPGIPRKIEAVRETIININNEKGRRIDKTIIELIL